MTLLQKISKVNSVADEKIAPLSDIEEYPVPTYQFSIEIDDKTVALFQSVSGISVTREVEPLKVGGENNFGREFPGHISFGHITLQVGLTSSDFFWKWMMTGQLDGYALSKDFTLVQRRPNPKGDKPNIFVEVRCWDFKNAFPVSWKISDLNIDDSTKIVMESLELSFDYFLPGTLS
jgi:phage tail-like protein